MHWRHTRERIHCKNMRVAKIIVSPYNAYVDSRERTVYFSRYEIVDMLYIHLYYWSMNHPHPVSHIMPPQPTTNLLWYKHTKKLRHESVGAARAPVCRPGRAMRAGLRFGVCVVHPLLA